MSRDALVVGINQYYTLKSLNTPAADAEAIAQYLETYGNFQVVHRLPLIIQNNQYQVDAKTELGELVTAIKLKLALAQLFNPKGTTFPETALFFFAGHGLREDIGDIQEGYLATSDINPKVNNYGVSLQWLRRLLKKSPIKQQVVWLDCCYSGELFNFDEADPGERGKGRDRCFIAAAREYESAYEETTGNHGILTGALLQGLDPKQSSDGVVNNLILTDFINQKFQGTPQRPLYANSGSKIILTCKKEHWRLWQIFT